MRSPHAVVENLSACKSVFKKKYWQEVEISPPAFFLTENFGMKPHLIYHTIALGKVFATDKRIRQIARKRIPVRNNQSLSEFKRTNDNRSNADRF